MFWDNFLKFPNIAYLNWKHKKGIWNLDKNPTFFI
jgi:hypothetical protein